MKERNLVQRIQSGEFVVNQKPPLAPEIGQRCPVCDNILVDNFGECDFCGSLQSWLNKKRLELEQLRKKIEEERKEKKSKFLEALSKYFSIEEHPKQEALLQLSFSLAGFAGCNGDNITDQLTIFEILEKLVLLVKQ